MHSFFKQVKHIKQFLLNRFAVGLFLVAAVLVLSPACGKRRPPVPPSGTVSQRASLSGRQVGDRIVVSWQMPARNAPGSSVQNISRVDVYRLAEPLSSPIGLTEEEFASRSTLIGTVSVTDDDFGLKKKSYTDSLRFAGQAVRLRYAIRFVNSSGQKASFSNFLLVEPTARIARPPASVRPVLSQDSITLAWTPPTENVDGSRPANITGYNVYRTEPSGARKLLNEKPMTEPRFADGFFDFGTAYSYAVRTVSVANDGSQLESIDSPEAKITPVDTFAPNAPDSLTIAASPNTISIFFASNTENDIAGYVVFRSTDRNLELADWRRMTRELLTVTTFRDSTVLENVTYFYYIVAVDKNGNTSGHSAIVSETAF